MICKHPERFFFLTNTVLQFVCPYTELLTRCENPTFHRRLIATKSLFVSRRILSFIFNGTYFIASPSSCTIADFHLQKPDKSLYHGYSIGTDAFLRFLEAREGFGHLISSPCVEWLHLAIVPHEPFGTTRANIFDNFQSLACRCCHPYLWIVQECLCSFSQAQAH